MSSITFSTSLTRILTPDGFVDKRNLSVYKNHSNLKTMLTIYDEKRQPQYSFDYNFPTNTTVDIRSVLLKMVVYQPELAHYYSVDFITGKNGEYFKNKFSGNSWPFVHYWQGVANKSYTVATIKHRLKQRGLNEDIDVSIDENLNIIITEKNNGSNTNTSWDQHSKCLCKPNAVGHIFFGLGYIGLKTLTQYIGLNK